MMNTDYSISQLIYGTKYQHYSNEIQDLFMTVKQEGLNQQKLNYDDILFYMNRLISENPNICERIAKSFDFIMVDEYQDTNDLQASILMKLGKYNPNIVVVGDISQSIYKFRGARVENLQYFIDSFQDVEVFNLKVNYRSTQEIIDATNSVMNKNVYNWKYVNMVSDDKHGDKPVLIHHRDDYAQCEWILRKLEDLVTQGYDLSQIAIIERKSMSSFKLENELAKAKIPFIKRGGYKFTDYAVVGDILSFLACVTKKSDKFNWFNVFTLLPGVASKTATLLSNDYNKSDFLQIYAKRKFIKDLTELMEFIEKCKKEKDVTTLINNISDFYFELRTIKAENMPIKEALHKKLVSIKEWEKYAFKVVKKGG